MFKKTILIVATLFFTSPLLADAAIADRYVDDAKVVGKSRFRVLLWNVFDAELYAQAGKFDAEQPFALALSYLREISSGEIVAKSIEEMKNQADYSSEELTAWRKQLDKIIPDVNSSSTITGIRNSQGQSIFYLNGERIGEVADERFTRAFFNIWLGEKTSETKLRRELLGL